jgi:hypothetical protein
MGTTRGSRKVVIFRVAAAAVLAAVAVLVAAGTRNSAQAGPLCVPGGTTVPVTADAKVSSGHPNRHYGHADTWDVNYARTKVRSLLTFGLPTVPMGCSVSKATLELTGRYSGTPNPPNHWPGANVNVSIVKHHWTEAGVTWRTMPAANACDGGTQDYARTNHWNLTGIVQIAYACLDSGELAAWNGLKAKGYSPPNRGASWRLVVASRESEHRPVVAISWS